MKTQTFLSMLILAAWLLPLSVIPAKDAPQVRAVKEARAEKPGGLYVHNRAPLQPVALLKLPIGSITPRGWLRYQLELEAKGMTGRLMEISPWCKFEGNAWASPQGKGHSGWEELPYWLKGYGDLGYVLKDEKIIKEARRWIEGMLASQEPDGWFGPRALKTSLKGQPDLWPHMVMLNVLQSFYEFSKDERVVPFMTRYCKWLNGLPPQSFGAGYWPRMRFGDNIETAYWLYNRTGEAWLLDLARKIHENMANWTQGLPMWHNVNLAQGFREPGVYFLQAKDPKFLKAAERNYTQLMDMYGQFPGGGFAGDENCRPGYTDPRQAIETCGIVEFMHSFEMLAKITGNPLWVDRCEEIAFNSFPASLTPDLKALKYLTGANMIQLDRKNKSPGLQNGGTMLSYSPFQGYRCCQHNVSHGWPYYAEELWLATADKGLCASLYAASEVTAQVGEGNEVKIIEETDYPFSDTIKLRFSAPQAIRFPLYLRVPRWSGNPVVQINGQSVPVTAGPLSFLVLDRQWADGDLLTLQLPMRVTVRTWPKNKNAVSVDYGPLTFALKIGEKWSRYGTHKDWPEWEVFPTTPWNYGLVLDAKDPAKSFEVVRKEGPLAAQPFTHEGNPIELRVQVRKIPAWQQDRLGLVGLLQLSPARSQEPIETVTLVPMGAARLRIASFPTIGTGEKAHEWTAPPQPKPSPFKPSASHVYGLDALEALTDGLEPANSNDHAIPRFTWWDHKGTQEWVQLDFDRSRQVSGVAVYWFDDTGHGQCRVPESWKLLYRDGQDWKPVPTSAAFGTRKDGYNQVSFPPFTTTALRIEVQLQPKFSGGILEWKVLE